MAQADTQVFHGRLNLPGRAPLGADFAQALQNVQQGELDAAALRLQQMLAAKPDHVDSLNLLGVVELRRRRPLEALARFDQALQHQPDLAVLHNNRGCACNALRRWEAALLSFDRALALSPDYADAHSNRGNTLLGLNLREPAAACHERALQLQPGMVMAMQNLAVIRLEQRRPDDALALFDQALAVDPQHADVAFYRSMTLLLQGDFAAGWPAYESRWRYKDFVARHASFTQPLWLGQVDLTGQTLMLRCEQGLGDTLQFCRYAPLLAARGAKVVLEVQASLVGLLQSLPGIAQVVAQGQPLPPFDLYCPLLSLPLACRALLPNIPADTPYLVPPADRTTAWEQWLGPRQQPRIGLVWRGNDRHKRDRLRSIALDQLLGVLPAGFDYICLQREISEGDARLLALHGRVRRADHGLVDFGDTAALCQQLDLVISVDTSVAHLAGALGKPTWLLLPHCPDWRWQLGRDDSPWYPTMRLFRQQDYADWSSTLLQLAEALRQRWPAPAAAPRLQINGGLRVARLPRT